MVFENSSSESVSIASKDDGSKSQTAANRSPNTSSKSFDEFQSNATGFRKPSVWHMMFPMFLFTFAFAIYNPSLTLLLIERACSDLKSKECQEASVTGYTARWMFYAATVSAVVFENVSKKCRCNFWTHTHARFVGKFDFSCFGCWHDWHSK
jgi:hypothetical protein